MLTRLSGPKQAPEGTRLFSFRKVTIARGCAPRVAFPGVPFLHFGESRHFVLPAVAPGVSTVSESGESRSRGAPSARRAAVRGSLLVRVGKRARLGGRQRTRGSDALRVERGGILGTEGWPPPT